MAHDDALSHSLLSKSWCGALVPIDSSHSKGDNKKFNSISNILTFPFCSSMIQYSLLCHVQIDSKLSTQTSHDAAPIGRHLLGSFQANLQGAPPPFETSDADVQFSYKDVAVAVDKTECHFSRGMMSCRDSGCCRIRQGWCHCRYWCQGIGLSPQSGNISWQ